MLKYALFGCKVKNGAKQLEGGWHDWLASAATIEELKTKLEDVEEDDTIMVFNEETRRHDKISRGKIIDKYFIESSRDIVGNTKQFGHRIHWYQIVDLETGTIVEEWEWSIKKNVI